MSKSASAKSIGKDKADYPILLFALPEDWEKWLEEHHTTASGVWLKFYKKAAGITSVNYAQALDVALCFGWIDGQVKKNDEESYLQKFTPRRAKSIWSKKNIENLQRLQKEGRMRQSGLKEAETAKSDGRWDQAYDSPENMKIPDEFLIMLSKNKKSLTFFESLNRANIYAIGWRLQTARKPETREKRMKSILEMLARGEKFH
jgi:uncharacterized protein YdeI (YjbR/CyaY-like superfamily)